MPRRKKPELPDEPPPGSFCVGEFETEKEAALAYDRAMLIVDPDIPREELNFDPSESEHVTFPPEILRQLHAIRDGKGPLH